MTMANSKNIIYSNKICKIIMRKSYFQELIFEIMFVPYIN